jgi:ATP-binding cassette subfamily C protein
LIVLDEPNSNLDSEGDQALMKALVHLKERGRTVLLVTHQAAALQTADKLLVLKEGSVATFGDRDQVLKMITGEGRQIRVAAGSASDSSAGGLRPTLVPAAH